MKPLTCTFDEYDLTRLTPTDTDVERYFVRKVRRSRMTELSGGSSTGLCGSVRRNAAWAAVHGRCAREEAVAA